jgi:hypothetical protein
MKEHIHQSNLIEGYDSKAMDVAGMRAWKYLKMQSKLTNEVVQRVQYFVVSPQKDLESDQIGFYRDRSGVDVRVGTHVAPRFYSVPNMMNQWLASFGKPPYMPKQAHIQFEDIHPFVDGNGRTGRLIMWWMQEKMGEKPTLITYDDRFEYYKWFEETRKNVT